MGAGLHVTPRAGVSKQGGGKPRPYPIRSGPRIRRRVGAILAVAPGEVWSHFAVVLVPTKIGVERWMESMKN